MSERSEAGSLRAILVVGAALGLYVPEGSRLKGSLFALWGWLTLVLCAAASVHDVVLIALLAHDKCSTLETIRVAITLLAAALTHLSFLRRRRDVREALAATEDAMRAPHTTWQREGP